MFSFNACIQSRRWQWTVGMLNNSLLKLVSLTFDLCEDYIRDDIIDNPYDTI